MYEFPQLTNNRTLYACGCHLDELLEAALQEASRAGATH